MALVVWDLSGAPAVVAGDGAPRDDRPKPPVNAGEGRILVALGFRSPRASKAPFDLPAGEIAKWFRSSNGRDLEGAFTFVLWDPSEHRLLALADCSSHHRLFYAPAGRGVVVGTSARSVAEWIGRVEPNRQAIARFVCEHWPEAGESFYAGVKALKKGQMLVADIGGWRLESYWRLDPPRRPKRLPDEIYIEQLDSILEEVHRDFLPEEPFGIALSGGLDSGCVAAYARQVRPTNRIVALRANYRELPGADEGRASERVARRLGFEDRPFEASHLYPFSSPGTFPTLADSPHNIGYSEWYQEFLGIARSAGLRQLVLGIGGDNLFGDFVRPYADLLGEGHVGRLLSLLGEDPLAGRRSQASLFWRFAVRPWMLPLGAFWKRSRWLPKPWLGRSLVALVDGEMDYPRREGWSPGLARRWQLVESDFLADTIDFVVQIGRRMDIEVRCPLWDHRLREFALTLPPDLCYRPPVDKWILRRTLAKRLPRAVLEQKKTSLRDLALRGFRERSVSKFRYLLCEMRAAEWGFVEPGPLRRSYDDFVEGKSSDSTFWNALCLEAWLRQHF